MLHRRLFAVIAIATALATSACLDDTKSAPTGQGSTSTSSTVAAPLQNRRADNGAVVQQNGLNGSGELKIVNGNSSDCAIVVTSSDPKSPQATIYVQGNSNATLSGIAGSYFVYMKYGTDWDQAALGFTRDQEFSKFDDVFDADTEWEITLQPSIGGNASTSDVPSF
ncbi:MULTISPECIES: hypothetical protein [Nocardia]|uniref:Lipoprotein n=1 Tax=Nocardia ignorata TaxID=145285 RepID=A0A4R6PUD4_NOCIG|nr:hypothetical protein [Nocardia ignorata]TDP40936.1 hypothetical protein DFR75_10134 [Nocardia ignorata]